MCNWAAGRGAWEQYSKLLAYRLSFSNILFTYLQRQRQKIKINVLKNEQYLWMVK